MILKAFIAAPVWTILALTWVLKVRSQSQLKSIATKPKLPNYQRVKSTITPLLPMERSPTRSCLHAPPTHPQLTCCHFPSPVPSPAPHHFPIECSCGFTEFLPLSASSYRAMPQIYVIPVLLCTSCCLLVAFGTIHICLLLRPIQQEALLVSQLPPPPHSYRSSHATAGPLSLVSPVLFHMLVCKVPSAEP